MKAITERELRDCLGQCRTKVTERGEAWDARLSSLKVDYKQAAEHITVHVQERFRCKRGVIGCRMGTSHHLHG